MAIVIPQSGGGDGSGKSKYEVFIPRPDSTHFLATSSASFSYTVLKFNYEDPKDTDDYFIVLSSSGLRYVTPAGLMLYTDGKIRYLISSVACSYANNRTSTVMKIDNSIYFIFLTYHNDGYNLQYYLHDLTSMPENFPRPDATPVDLYADNGLSGNSISITGIKSIKIGDYVYVFYIAYPATSGSTKKLFVSKYSYSTTTKTLAHVQTSFTPLSADTGAGTPGYYLYDIFYIKEKNKIILFYGSETVLYYIEYQVGSSFSSTGAINYKYFNVNGDMTLTSTWTYLQTSTLYSDEPRPFYIRHKGNCYIQIGNRTNASNIADYLIFARFDSDTHTVTQEDIIMVKDDGSKYYICDGKNTLYFGVNPGSGDMARCVKELDTVIESVTAR